MKNRIFNLLLMASICSCSTNIIDPISSNSTNSVACTTNLSYNNLFTYDITSDNTAKITSIIDGEFLTSIYIPEIIDEKYTITEIGANAFSNLQCLNKVILPDSIIKIGENAFNECIHLRFVNIPKSTIEICNGAFMRCFSLTNLEFPEGLKYLSGLVFCTNLKDFQIPSTIIYIGSLKGCSNLRRLSIPDGIEDLSGFWEMSKNHINIDSFNYPQSMKEYYDSFFSKFYNLNQLNYSGTIEQWSNISINKYGYYGNPCNIKIVHCTDGDIELLKDEKGYTYSFKIIDE